MIALTGLNDSLVEADTLLVDTFLMRFLLNNPIISESVAKYVRLSTELRAFLLEQHRNSD